MALTIDQIISKNAVQTDEVEVPEWGGTVLLRGLSKRDQQHIWKTAAKGKDPTDMDTEILNKMLFQYGVVEPKISDEDYEKLQDGYAGTLDKIVLKVMKLSRFSEDDLKEVQRSFPVQS